MKRQTRTILLAVVFLVLPILLLVPSSRAQVVRISRGALLIPKQVLSLAPKAAVRSVVRPRVKAAVKQAVSAGEAAVRASGAPLNVPAGAAKSGSPAVLGMQGTQVPALSGSAAGSQLGQVPPPPAAPAVVLYDQYNNGTGVATLSATFTDFPTFSADLGDDFVVPGGQTWNVMSVDADGVYFNGAGPATSFNVFFYSNSGTLPGAQVFSALNQPVTQVGSTFTVNLAPAAVLAPGTYWVEMQANMTFGTQGEWGWTDRTVQSNQGAAWQNPGGGFGICPVWDRKTTCIPTAGGPDQVYRLNGTIGGGVTPTPTPTPGPCQIHVLIVHSDTSTPNTLRAQILAEPNVVAVDLFDASVGTPTLAQLQAHEVVYTYSNLPYADGTTHGNNLADYQDGGGIVVAGFGSFYGPPYSIEGRWHTGGYSPYNYVTSVLFNPVTLGTHDGTHPLMLGVAALNAVARIGVTVAGGATEVAAYSDGTSAVAFKPTSGNTAVGMPAYLGDSGSGGSGDNGRVIANAGRWLLGSCHPTPTPTPTPAGQLTDLSPAKMWVGLKNSDDVGTRLDLLAEVFINATKVGQGEIDNVGSGSSGFNNAILQTIPLSLIGGPAPAPPGSQLKIRVSARRTCTGGGHTSGTPRLWYNGQPIDTGATRDAGSRFDATIGGSNSDYFLRTGFALDTTPGAPRTSADVFVNSSAACPARPFTSWGTWVRTLP